MHLQKFEFLVEVAKTGSFSVAAENLHASQSGISQAITKIEDELGMKIFDRTRFGATLTKDGAKIVQKAQDILFMYEEFKEIARKSVENQSSEIRVSTIPFFINYLLDPLMEFRKLHSNLQLEFLENITNRTIESVKKNQIDIGIICLYEGIIKEIEELNSDVILEGQMKVYVSSSSIYAKTKKISPEELVRESLVLYNGDYIKWFINNFQESYSKLTTILFSSNHTEELFRSVLNGTAITIAPDFTLIKNPHLLDGTIVEVDLTDYEPIRVTLGMIYSKKKRFTSIEKKFIKFIKSELQSYLS